MLQTFFPLSSSDKLFDKSKHHTSDNVFTEDGLTCSVLHQNETVRLPKLPKNNSVNWLQHFPPDPVFFKPIIHCEAAGRTPAASQPAAVTVLEMHSEG